MDTKNILRELVETPGVSGSESQIREKIKEKIEDHADSVETDNMGNLIARKGSGDKTLMIAAHMDQIGLTVRRIDENGFIKVSKIGGIFPEGIINQRVIVHASEGEPVKGILGMKPPHLKKKEEKNKGLPDMKKLFVDTGAEDEEDLEERGVRIGDYISYDRGFTELRNGYVSSPCLDNRVGCVIGIKALEKFSEDYELVVVFTTQEEVGTKGARTAAFKIDPDVAIAVDTGMAGDVPGIDPDESDDETGNGVGIDMVQAGGRGLIASEKIKDWLITTGKEGNHNYYRSLYDGGATDAAGIYLAREGIPTGSLSIPTRHIHSPVEIVNLSDIEDGIKFLEDAFTTLEDYF